MFGYFTVSDYLVYLILMLAKQTKISIRVIIQKRTIIFGSDRPFFSKW